VKFGDVVRATAVLETFNGIGPLIRPTAKCGWPLKSSLDEVPDTGSLPFLPSVQILRPLIRR